MIKLFVFTNYSNFIIRSDVLRLDSANKFFEYKHDLKLEHFSMYFVLIERRKVLCIVVILVSEVLFSPFVYLK